jgi:cytoskeletal protein CcmA (bactofilin family)
VDGGLNSDETIEIDGSTTIRGDIKAKNVLFGTNAPLRGKRGNKHPYKVFGKIFAEYDLVLINTFIEGDVRGRNVKIGRKTEVIGHVYYIDTVDVDPKATLDHVPIQISELKEKKLEK